jgi:hypothetical protein
VVVFAGEFDDTYADNWGWNLHYGGKMVILNMDGASGPYFEYGHNSQVLVKAGDRVRRGQVIAITGNTDGGTGVSTGPHCHVGCLPPNFNLGTSTYGRVNPRLYMTEYPDSSGSLSYAGESISSLSEEDDMPFTDKDIKQLVTEGVQDYFRLKGEMQDGRNVIDHLNQTRTDVISATEAGRAAEAAAKAVPSTVLFDTRVDGRNVFDTLKQIRTDLFGTRADGSVDVEALASALSERLESRDLASLAEKLQITVKEEG